MGKPGIIARPPNRKLWVYAFDPGLQTSLDKARISAFEIEVPWEDYPQDLLAANQRGEQIDGPAPGPIGEYLEIIDYDPASGCFWEPVDLNNPYLLANNGLSPSGGNPLFHQQMVYAVAMKTIKKFERALGRMVLWSSRRISKAGKIKKEEYVPRLRIYPHAMREANAYYSPHKKALLFGYFNATQEYSGKHLPGGIVFTCLSQDIIAHEMTHALLDGLHRRFNENTNPDVLALHEAFADIVALFQHFTYPEVVKYGVARERGDIKTDDLLLGLARELGYALGRSRSLRQAIGTPPDPTLLETTLEPHDRGSILVATIFDAFLSIYQNRTKDLIRLATGGTGVLKEGALHPDLVNRLAQEASKSATHILNICIRALDYLPPIDVTFGDYLRAIITADKDMVPEDVHGYRVALIEAFRNRGIYPRNIKSLSEESLVWEGPAKGQTAEEGQLTFVRELLGLLAGWDLIISRKEFFDLMEYARRVTHEIIKETWDPKKRYLKGLSGHLQKDIFEVHSIRPVRRVGPDGQVLTDLLIEITQKRPGFLDKDYGGISDRKSEPDFWFRGGCTILIDRKLGQLRYCIFKDIDNKARYQRHQQYLKERWKYHSLREMYLGDIDKSDDDTFFKNLHSFYLKEND
jgi:hypothetical protein